MMSYYFMVNIRIKDKQAYQKYMDHSGEIFAKYKGTCLAVDNEPEVLEVDWDYSRGKS